jgi:hypothetical protein
MVAGSELFVAHQLGLVDIQLAFEAHVRLTRTLSEHDLHPMNLGVVPDAYVEYAHQEAEFSAFVEYDRGTETLGTIERKARGYLDLALSGRFSRQFQRRFFRTLLVTDTVGRLSTLSSAVARVTDRVMRLTTLGELVALGPQSAIWRRPGSHVSESLTT